MDNAIVFCDAKEEQLINPLAILRCFKALSSRQTNFRKSNITGVAIEMEILLSSRKKLSSIIRKVIHVGW